MWQTSNWRCSLCSHGSSCEIKLSIEGLTRIQKMPYWWTTAQWREQYPLHIKCNADISMETIKGKYRTDDSLFYCPTWTGGMKKGRPKANAREKGIADYIKDSGKKRKRIVRYFCQICQKYNINEHHLSNLKATWTKILQTYSGVTNEWRILEVTQKKTEFLTVTQNKIKIRGGDTND